jgi:hypothetical protein
MAPGFSQKIKNIISNPNFMMQLYFYSSSIPIFHRLRHVALLETYLDAFGPQHPNVSP